ncbi:hypothetical protein AGMMS50268_23930 [Spirochaetia bacterium]|nr:hypothetical protein AGMMS50268_23930 [Spirochaetia bacterium]
MKWNKLGQIFNFNETPFKDRFVSHAQSPQALVFDDFIRIYFTTRIKDTEKTFISVPQFADFTKNFSKILNFSKSDIITQGNLGCFDEHGIFPFSPLRVGNKIFAYTTGWTRRISVDVDTGIGLAVSDNNGEFFIRPGDGPILTSSLQEPFLVCDGFIRHFGGLFHMWYIYGTSWKEDPESHVPERTYIIGHAVSQNGIEWIKDNRPIIKQNDETECQALPTVIKSGTRYYMYFCFRNTFNFRTNPQNMYDLGFAYSDDLDHWIRDDSNKGIHKSTTKGDWDCDMMCYPNLFQVDNRIYMLYNGNDFGKHGFGLAVLEDETI